VCSPGIDWVLYRTPATRTNHVIVILIVSSIKVFEFPAAVSHEFVL